MFRRARLSVKPNVRPGAAPRAPAAPAPQRGREAARPPEPAAASGPKPAESTAAPPAGLGGAQPPEKAPRSSDEKPDGENVVEESGKSSSTVSQRKKRVSRTPTLVKPSVSVPSEPHPLSPVNKEAPQPDPVPAKEKQPCSDRYRIYKAQKLREMLKEELRKEKKQWKNKCAINESQRPPDRSKMTMRDFIYYLPDNNPMTSSLEQEKKTEKSLTPVQTREQESKSTPEAEDEDEVEEEMDEGPLLVPRVKVAEDGSIILDEESLTVEVLRTKGPCVVEENDPIFERGSTTTYSSFRKNYYSKPWSNKETDMFFLAISMVGTDFSMIGQLFPHRARIEIKNKFKREEKTNGWRIDKAFQEKRPFDFDFFAHLLQKVLAEEEKRKQKSVKNQSLKEKKSSKPRKNVKVKKVASEGVNDDAAESVSTKIPDPEGSQKDAQTAGEEEESLTLSGQDSEQIVLEPNLNQNKRRRKTQDEVGKQEVQNLSGNATVQSGPSKGEKHKDKCQSSRPEINEGEGNKEQKLSCVQNVDDVVDLSSSEKVEEKTDRIVSLSSQPDAVSVAAETPGSSTSDLPSSEVGIRALCEVNDAENSCTEGRHADLKNKSPETDQRENVKPVARGRLQRPKPNLSRAIGKKPAISQGKTDAESESLHLETSMEKNHLEKDKRNTFDISETENTEREHPEAETVSNSSEKICLQEDDQPKAFRPTRLTRGRLRRPKPNVGKAAERKEILPSQEKIGVNVENSENESSVDRGTPEQIEDQSCQNVECEDITSQSEEKGTSFQNVQPDEPKTLNECVSIQEDNKANTLKQVPMVKTRFQKPKPNVGRGIGRRKIFSKEEVSEEILTSGEMTTALREVARLGASPRENGPVEANTTEEMKSDLTETERRGVSPMEKTPEMIDITVDMETGLEETGRGVSLRDRVPEVTDATEERKTDLEESGREISLEEKAPEAVSTVGDMETGLEETGRGVSPRDKVLVGINAIGGKEVDLKETGKGAISLTEKVLGKTTAVEETQADLEETGREISLRKSRSEEISTTEEMVADLEKTGKIDISLRGNVPEETGISRQTETDLMESIRAVGSALPSLNLQNIGTEALPVVPVPGEEERSSEKEGSSQLSHLKTSSQTPELGETEDQGMLSPDAPERFSDANLSKSLPQEQKPLEVKPAPFVRSRFKRPKPNLARAALKREMTETGMSVPGKKLETGKAETGVIQQSREQTNMLPSQHDVAFLMTSREKDGSGPRPEEAVVSPCVQIEKDLSSPSFCEPVEESQAARAQGEEGVVSVRTQNINTFQQEMKESVTQTAPSVRGRLQRPRPNIRKAGQRQRVEKGEAEGIVEEERTVVQKDETEKKFLTGANFQIGTEVEVVPSKVSEGGMSENQSHVVLVGNLPVNKVSVLDEKTRHEHETCVPGPAQLIRRRFQKAGPNLGRAHGEKEAAAVEEDRAEQSEAKKPEDNLLDQEDSDTQLLQKEKAEFLTSLAVSARKDSVGSREAVWAKKDAESSRAAGDKSASSGVEEQHLSKLTSCPQLLKESDYSKIALDQRTTVSSASECEGGRSERRTHRKSKPNVTKGRGSKRIRTKTSKKGPRASRAVLVTLRASQEEDEDDTEDFECDYEEETYHLAPEEVNKAPVFVPLGLRSPEPVSAQIEETMEELEITVNVPDVGCITVDEPQLLHTDAATQEMKQGDLNSLSLEMTTGGHTPDETGANDGSTEAAITLLTMGDLVLQSEISTEQSDVGVCVLPDGHSKDKSHIPFSPDNVDHRIVHECQELPSAVNSASPSLEESKIVLEEQSSKEESGLVENVKENAVPARNATSEVTSNLRMRSRLAEPKPNLRILGTRRFGAHQEVPGLFVTKGEEVDIQRETEKNASKATELEDKNLGSVTTAESKEQSRSARVHGIEESSVSKEAQLTGRNEDQEEGCHEGGTLSVAPFVSFETRPHAFGLGQGLHEGAVEEPLRKDADGDGVLTLHVPQCTPASIPEVQQENVIPPQDLTVNLVANMHQDGEEEQAFILTLVEIPTSAVEEFTDPTVQLTPSPLLPAPILVRSVSTEERGDMSMSFPVASVGQDAMCLSDSGREDSEEPPASLDLVSRKRFHCRLDDSDHVPPAKKSALLSRDTCQKYTSEVCSKELINVFEETGEPFRGQGVFPPSGRTHTTPEPQKEQLESAFQSLESRCLDKVTDTHIEKNTPQIPQAERTVSDKDEGTCAAPKSEQMDSITSSSKAPLSRPGRRPLGFLSLICSKNGLESDEPSQVHSKKRLKPLIPVSRQSLKRSNPPSEGQKKIQESSALLPSPKVVVDTQSENTGGSAAQVSCDHPLPKEEGKSVRNRAPEGEPTTVSEYFFSDIFIEVDETE
ncbi:transcription factor TFIIIB component B'' homolog isoform X2 [Equus quagga]|uniref:transcription factor TFIIIB component B'' homolog isoform X2 n=1 Tax=Equus quagga TaxID=89248 RepID=UPI001EE1ECE7|nr:transcription factor TFIIIB component B'' homolog isoform X2 [Equus quagga]